MNIIWSPQATTRVAEIAEFMAQDRPTAATAWVQETFLSVRNLQRFPLRGPMVPEIGRPDVRQLLLGRYRVIYRVDDTSLTVLTVRSARERFDPREVEETDDPAA